MNWNLRPRPSPSSSCFHTFLYYAALLLVVVINTGDAFSPICLSGPISSGHGTRRSSAPTFLRNSGEENTAEIHPAVAGWPEKYGMAIPKDGSGPKILSEVFAIERAANPTLLDSLDVANWPTWTTSDKEKWAVGNQNADKVMPYGELSYMICGRLEIIPQSTGEAVVVESGDLVTFPEGFTASWKVLEEVTWYYYLY